MIRRMATQRAEANGLDQLKTMVNVSRVCILVAGSLALTISATYTGLYWKMWSEM